MRGKRGVFLATAAQIDLDNIAAWTSENFGPTQAETYIEAILDGVMGRVETRPPIVGDIGRPSN
jgi:plasmid stabilization system protein ParE